MSSTNSIKYISTLVGSMFSRWYSCSCSLVREIYAGDYLNLSRILEKKQASHAAAHRPFHNKPCSSAKTFSWAQKLRFLSYYLHPLPKKTRTGGLFALTSLAEHLRSAATYSSPPNSGRKVRSEAFTASISNVKILLDEHLQPERASLGKLWIKTELGKRGKLY